MPPERVSLFCLKLSKSLGVPVGVIESACEQALGEKIATTVLHSGICPSCGVDIAGPIANTDDVKWSLGHWILGGALEYQKIEDLIRIANEQIEMLTLQKELQSKMEEGFLVSYFSPHLRQDIKNVIEKMDQVSDGPRRAVDRSHENALLLQQSRNDAMGYVESNAGVSSGRDDEADSVTPDIFPPPGMFCLD